MTDSTEDPHVRFSLGLYLLDALAPQERDAVEAHLADCPECQVECDELSDALAALALLSEEEGREVAEEFGLPLVTPATGGARPVAVLADPAAPPAPRPPVDTRPPAATQPPAATRPAAATRPPADSRPAADSRPPAGRPATAPAAGSATRPGGPRRRRLSPRTLLGLTGLVLVVFISAGILLGVGLNDSGGKPGRPVDVTLAATAQDTATGATLSVVATGHDGAVTIRAAVAGLHHGTTYKLYAVTSDGRTRVVATWKGEDGPHDVSGEVPVRVTQLSFFSVTLADDTVVVSAYLPRSAGPSPR